MSDSQELIAKEYARKVLSAKEYAPRAGQAFEEVHGYRDSKTTIAGAENGAISLSQLRNLWKQVEFRCVREGWRSTRPGDGSLLKPENVTLYDLVKYVILPLTLHRKCSYVEMVAQGPQVPKWFVSHWWGEPLVDFLKCLEQHAEDHKLDAETAYYWVCAYANNQWDLNLGDDDLKTSPFYKAMRKSEGTVSILDNKGVVFTRIWCGYELYISLLVQNGYKWCVYTGDSNKAVGLTEGNAPADNWSGAKWNREKAFPHGLIEDALTVDIDKCEATEKKDKDLILETIGEDVVVLNSSLKGRFAAAGLRIVLEDDNEEMWFSFLEAISNGKAKTLSFDFSSCGQFDESKQEELRKHIDWKSLEKLTLNFNSLDLGNAGVIRVVNGWHFDKIVDLSLIGNEIGEEGAIALGKSLAKNTALRELILAFNQIGPEGAKAIGHALQINYTLERLDMESNQIGDAGAEAIAKALQINSTLELLVLPANNIGQEAKKVVRDAWGNRSGKLYV